MNEFLNNKNDIEDWLSSRSIFKYTIRDDLTVDVPERVRLSDRALTYLPVQFGVVDGHFNIANNMLKNLKGCPHRVNGSFRCNNNQIESLEMGPSIVESYFCNNNMLTSLKGIPDVIEGEFLFYDNHIKTFEHAPKKVGILWCDKNPITSLNYLPEITKQFIFKDTGIVLEQVMNYPFKHNIKLVMTTSGILKEFHNQECYSTTINELNKLKLFDKLNNDLSDNSQKPKKLKI